MSIIFLKVHQKRKPMMRLIHTSVSVLYVNFSIIYTNVENSMTLHDKQTHGRPRKGHNSRSTNIQEDNSRHVLETDDLLFLFFCPLLHKIIKYISINILYSHSLYPSFSFQAADEMALKDDTSSAFPL